MVLYNKDKWLKRLRQRSDISGYITHFTKEQKSLSVIDVLVKILNERKIIGSTTDSGFIIGSNKAVCFQDAPLYGLSQNLLHEQYNRPELGSKVRYKPCGLAFSKIYAFKKGARPVIYEQKSIAKKVLPESDWWRIVNFDLNDEDNIIDWTHEREWRIKGDFDFEIEETFVYLVNNNMYKLFLKKAGGDLIKQIKGIVVLDPVLS